MTKEEALTQLQAARLELGRWREWAEQSLRSTPREGTPLPSIMSDAEIRAELWRWVRRSRSSYMDESKR